MWPPRSFSSITSPKYRRISTALAIGAPVHGLNPYPKVYRSLSERMPGYRCMSQVPPKLSRPSSTTKVRSGHWRRRWYAASTPEMPAPTTSTSKCSVCVGADAPRASVRLMCRSPSARQPGDARWVHVGRVVRTQGRGRRGQLEAARSRIASGLAAVGALQLVRGHHGMVVLRADHHWRADDPAPEAPTLGECQAPAEAAMCPGGVPCR